MTTAAVRPLRTGQGAGDVPTPATSRELILVVDDEESICETLAGVLEDESFQVVTANNGEQALELARSLQPAVAFVDIWMPGWDGLETLGKIKEVSPLTQVVMISGHASIANALEASNRGAFDFIEKPLDIEGVVRSVNRALEQRAAEQPTDSAELAVAAVHAFRGEAARLNHPGVCSRGLAGANRGQRTIKKSVVLYGQGLHTGQKSGLLLEPLPKNSGIHFGKIGASRTVPAFIDFVESTSFATTVHQQGTRASTIEHLMAALHAYGVSNILIKCNNEVPILDGSATEFCQLLESVGFVEQGGDWFEIAPQETVTFCPKSDSSAEQITIEPADVFTVAYELAYPEPVGKQFFEVQLSTPEVFRDQIAPARTFGFVRDVERLQRAGLAAGGRLDNFVLIGAEAVVNTKLRFEQEPVRHKILDIVGDLFLLGRPLRAKVTAKMTGHSDNVGLLRMIRDLAISE